MVCTTGSIVRSCHYYIYHKVEGGFLADKEEQLWDLCNSLKLGEGVDFCQQAFFSRHWFWDLPFPSVHSDGFLNHPLLGRMFWFPFAFPSLLVPIYLQIGDVCYYCYLDSKYWKFWPGFIQMLYRWCHFSEIFDLHIEQEKVNNNAYVSWVIRVYVWGSDTHGAQSNMSRLTLSSCQVDKSNICASPLPALLE